MPVTASQRTPGRVYLLGLLLTGAFYATAPFIPGIQPFVRRYFCSHPIEVLSTALFFCGIAVLFHRLLRLRAERSAIRIVEESASHWGAGSSAALRNCYEAQPAGFQKTAIAERLRDAVQYVNGSGDSGLEQHLRYLAELAADRLHQSYALIRTITWAIPILGFLGTVMGITIAIANLTPEQLDSSLPEVVGGLEAAFDTTALALGMSILLVFAAFVTERSEQNVLNIVERLGINHILPRFASQPFGHSSVLPDADDWNRQCEALQSVWTDTLSQHFELLSERLQSDVELTLDSHREAATAARFSLDQTMKDSAAEYAKTMTESLCSFSDRVDHWQRAMLVSSTSAAEQTEAIHQLGRTLMKMNESEERLAGLQKQLNDNLQAVRTADALEQAVSSLSAAVNLLTTKTSHRTAA
ncbi:MAG: MotA/TolQ/ExbB proton channel family protein [Fuerstiella sp.]|nr:MotA/TolQ/ExbB proton channel family protein [Fuerstiella sp.]